jgi:hypothetical protein
MEEILQTIKFDGLISKEPLNNFFNKFSNDLNEIININDFNKNLTGLGSFLYGYSCEKALNFATAI